MKYYVSFTNLVYIHFHIHCTLEILRFLNYMLIITFIVINLSLLRYF